MNKRYLPILLLCLIVFVCVSAAAADEKGPAPLTLSECYKLALKQSETIAINNETIREAQAHFLQALGTWLPHVSFSSFDTRQDVTRTDPTYERDTYQRNFVFTQTLFSGFRELAGITGSRIEKEQRINEKRRAQQLLFTDVSDAFYLLTELREDQKTLKKTQEVLVSRINELKQRERLGRSRRSEVVNAEVQLYSVEANLELADRQVEISRRLLEFLVGQPVGALANADKDLDGVAAEDDFLSKIMSRFDVVAAQRAWEVVKKKAYIATTDLFPSITAQGNYYTARNTQPRYSNWDASLVVNIPIFEGTETYGNIMQFRAQAREAELQFLRTKRQAAQDIRDAYENYRSSISRRDALKKALSAAEENYNLQEGDYKLSLVNNLDVLDSIRTLQDTRISYIQAFYEMKQFYWQLRITTGEFLPE